jgi:hypothetical protein
VICGEPLAECVYGWGHVLRLYPEHLEIQGKSYALSDLLNFKPTYRCILGVASMRLELQFVAGTVVVRGMADIGLALKFINYLNTWNDATVALTRQELYEATQLPFPVVARTPKQLVLSASEQESFWEYDAHDQPTVLVDAPDPADPPEIMETSRGLSLPLSLPPAAQSLSPVPWTDEHYLQHDQRLQSLQVEREIRFYGFDAAALAKRLRDEPLAPISVSVSLHASEVAYYRAEVRLFDEFSSATKRAKSKAKDQGTLLLTNQRIIYLGQKRHMMFGYERVLQVEQAKGALVLSTEYWTKKQFFCMQHPLECAMYLEHLLHCFQQIIPSAYVQTQAFDIPAQLDLLVTPKTLEASNLPD